MEFEGCVKTDGFHFDRSHNLNDKVVTCYSKEKSITKGAKTCKLVRSLPDIISKDYKSVETRKISSLEHALIPNNNQLTALYVLACSNYSYM